MHETDETISGKRRKTDAKRMCIVRETFETVVQRSCNGFARSHQRFVMVSSRQVSDLQGCVTEMIPSESRRLRNGLKRLCNGRVTVDGCVTDVKPTTVRDGCETVAQMINTFSVAARKRRPTGAKPM